MAAGVAWMSASNCAGAVPRGPGPRPQGHDDDRVPAADALQKGSAMGNIETYFDSAVRAWKNRGPDGRDLPGTHDRRGDAIARGRACALSHRTWHVIRDAEGAVASRRDYGVDPVREPAPEVFVRVVGEDAARKKP
jgi:hypothetical protein